MTDCNRVLQRGGLTYPRTCARCGIGPCSRQELPQPLPPRFSGLSDAEAERLDMLAERAAKIIVAVSKIKRHGYANYHPDRPNISNRRDLEREIGDLIGIARRMFKVGDVSEAAIDVYAGLKWRQAKKYTHHQGEDE